MNNLKIKIPTTSLFDRDVDVLRGWGAATIDAINRGLPIDVASHLAERTMQDHANKGGHFTQSLADSIQNGARRTCYIGAAWAECGFPILNVSHKLVALFMATGIPSEFATDANLPWDTFAIRTPDGGEGAIYRQDGKLVSTIGLARVSEYNPEAPSEVAEALYFWHACQNAQISSLPIANLGELVHKDADMLFTQSGIDDRSERLLRRLLVGTIIELDQPRYKETIGKGKPPKKIRQNELPQCWNLELRRDTTIDLRPWVKRYLSGGEGTAMTVQTMVRGHWKRQAHGPGRVDRKWIHIEPYWKGPDDAPIAVRDHVMGDVAQASEVT